MNREDELARRREVERANEAQTVISCPLWAEAWNTLETKLTDAWKASRTGEPERRELIYLQLRAAAEVRGHIEEVLVTGRLASEQLERSTDERRTGILGPK